MQVGTDPFFTRVMVYGIIRIGHDGIVFLVLTCLSDRDLSRLIVVTVNLEIVHVFVVEGGQIQVDCVEFLIAIAIAIGEERFLAFDLVRRFNSFLIALRT